MFRLFDITIDIIFFSINWKTISIDRYFVISMTVLINSGKIRDLSYLNIHQKIRVS